MPDDDVHERLARIEAKVDALLALLGAVFTAQVVLPAEGR